MGGNTVKPIVILICLGLFSSLLANETRQSAIDAVQLAGIPGVASVDTYLMFAMAFSVTATASFIIALSLVILGKSRGFSKF
jgi:hypothetical protein